LSAIAIAPRVSFIVFNEGRCRRRSRRRRVDGGKEEENDGRKAFVILSLSLSFYAMRACENVT
jgi:hypothetical protein